MNTGKLCAILLIAFCSLAARGVTTIEDVARQFCRNQIDVDSLFNYINNGHGGEAYWWALHNSEKNDPMAYYILGRCYLSGIGTTEDMSKAVPLFEKAINHGVDEALVDLGKMYINGWGVEKNSTKGIQYLKKASERKLGRGYDVLGLLYLDKQDYPKAYQLFNLAAAANYSGGYLDMGFMYENGFGVEQNDAKALELYRIAADKGNRIALCNVGLFYEHGKAVDMNHETALKYYMASAEKGDARGSYKVGYIHQWGDIPVEVSYEEAAKWYKLAVEKEYLPAKVAYALLLFDGLGVSEDKTQAIEILESVGMENVSPFHACRISEYFTEINSVKALKWAKFAHDNADEYYTLATTAKLLGMIYLKGGKELYDYQLAVKYLKEAAELGEPDCVALMKSLGEPFEVDETVISNSVNE